MATPRTGPAILASISSGPQSDTSIAYAYRHAHRICQQEFPFDSSIAGRFRCVMTRPGVDASDGRQALYQKLVAIRARVRLDKVPTFYPIAFRLEFSKHLHVEQIL